MIVNSSYGTVYGNCYARCIKLFDNYWMVSFSGTYASGIDVPHDAKIFNNTGIPFTPKESGRIFLLDDTARVQGLDYVIAATLETDKSLRFSGTTLPKEHWIALNGVVCIIQAV